MRPCHADKPAAWAAEAVERWHGPVRKGFQTYAGAFHRSRGGDPAARASLQRLAVDGAAPALARATAIDELVAWPAAASIAATDAGLSDADPLVRAAALRALEGSDRARRRAALPLLGDPVRLVRIAAAFLLADWPADDLTPAQAEARVGALAEQEAAFAIDLDRPETRANRALLRLKQGRGSEAETEYRAALALDPSAGAIAAQLADLYRRSGREGDAEQVLRAALARDPASGTAQHALGLSLIRQKRPQEALEALAQAARAEPGNARFAFVYGVALRSLGQPEEASRILREAALRHPADVDLATVQLQEAMQRRDRAGAAEWVRRLVALRPDDQRFRDLAGRLTP